MLGISIPEGMGEKKGLMGVNTLEINYIRV